MPINIDFEDLSRRTDLDESWVSDKDRLQILAPNSRTQKAIIAGFMKRYNQEQVAHSPAALAFNQWVDSLWQKLSFYIPLPRSISTLEIKFWLKEEISRDASWQLTNELGVAERLLEAYKNLRQWNLSLADIETPDTPEQAYFLLWMNKLENFLFENELIAEFQKIDLVLENLDKVRDELPELILLVGFNQLKPIEQTLIDKASALGCKIKHYYPERKNQSTNKVVCRDELQEVELAAGLAYRWSKDNPGENIGVVVHQLASKVEEVHRYFSEYFQAEESAPWQSLDKCRYNVSAGQSLNSVPQIVAALKILNLNANGLSPEDLRYLKNSPFIDWGEYSAEIKATLHALGLKGVARYSIHYLADAFERSEFSNVLHRLKDRINSLPERPYSSRPLKVWCDIWKKELNKWGWCTQDSRSDDNVVATFNQTLKVIEGFALSQRKFNASQALELLLQLLRQTSYQLPSDRTDVHVLGMLEALGLEFDRLILVGFSRENWPQKAKISPFLPLELQRENDMPGSSAEREFNYAEDASRSLLKAADHIWVTEVAEESQSLSSVFFENFLLAKIDSSEILSPGLSLSTDYQWLKDETVEIPEGAIKGGAYLLSNYAACPFKALSRHLFKIEAMEDVEEGVDARVRGTWLHAAMEYIWNELKQRKSLAEISEEDREHLVRKCVSKSHSELESNLYASAAPEVVQIEFEKLIRQINEWLELDLQKPEFSVETEVDKTLKLNSLEFRFKVDRIDSFEDGSKEIIDYKTGHVDIKKWLGPRPEEAQMPAYVIACEDELAAQDKSLDLNALSYAKIKTGEICRTGIDFSNDGKAEAYTSNKENNYKKLRLNLEHSAESNSLQEDWRKNLNLLAKNIAEGNMPVSPKDSSNPCQYCEYSGFCRISEAQPEEATFSTTVSSCGGDNE